MFMMQIHVHRTSLHFSIPFFLGVAVTYLSEQSSIVWVHETTDSFLGITTSQHVSGGSVHVKNNLLVSLLFSNKKSLPCSTCTMSFLFFSFFLGGGFVLIVLFLIEYLIFSKKKKRRKTQTVFSNGARWIYEIHNYYTCTGNSYLIHQQLNWYEDLLQQ